MDYFFHSYPKELAKQRYRKTLSDSAFSKQKARAIQCLQLAHFLSKFYQQSVGSIDSNESNARKFEINNDI